MKITEESLLAVCVASLLASPSAASCFMCLAIYLSFAGFFSISDFEAKETRRIVLRDLSLCCLSMDKRVLPYPLIDIEIFHSLSSFEAVAALGFCFSSAPPRHTPTQDSQPLF